MSTAAESALDPRADRLYALLPSIYRARDAGHGYPLQALLRVIAEQVNVLDDDIAQLYENWFIETCEDWLVPYIGALVGYRPVAEAGAPAGSNSAEGRALNRALVPRREVANTIRYRRRKGSLALLELLAADVANWPARAVEFYRLLGWNQHLNHQHPQRAHTADLRNRNALDLLNGPFERLAHSVDVRQIGRPKSRGRYNIPSLGVFVWRLRSYPVSRAPAYCAENAGPNCYTFSVLGQDAPLYVRPEPEADPTHIAGELNLPVSIRRLAFELEKGSYYGAGKSLAIYAEGWGGYDASKPVPAAAIIAADLSGWQYQPPLRHIAVDPVLGRFAFPPSALPKRGVRVNYQYGFSADMGGGEYPRVVFAPTPRPPGVTGDGTPPPAAATEVVYYRVGQGQALHNLASALHRWHHEKPCDAVIELTDSSVYVEPIYITLGPRQSLQLRAASGARPVLRLLDWQTDLPDALSISMAQGSRMVLDGLVITGRAVHVNGRARDSAVPADGVCAALLSIRHCTLVPGWGLDCDCEPKRPAEPSLELFNVRAEVRIEHSIIGSIQVHEDEVKLDPIPMHLTDSILDATDPDKEAIGAPGFAHAHAVLTVARCTVFGIVSVHAIALAENSIFNNCLSVARRQLGCMRFCYVPNGCRTPRRYRCQPDGVSESVRAQSLPAPQEASALAAERIRVQPLFTARHYGLPGYAQLAVNGALEIARGAEDEAEMGAFHDLYQPQRAANLQTRLDEYTPAGMDVALLLAS